MRMTRRLWISLVVGATLASGSGLGPAAAQSRDVLVFAAASMKNAMDDVARHWEAKTGKTVKVSYASSNSLIRQIEQGAPADIYISANPKWMDYGQTKNLIKPESRANVLGNHIVLIAPKDSTVTVKIGKGFDLAAALKGGHLAMAIVNAVPAGIYGKAALVSLGVWDSVKDKVAQAQNVRAALALVERGEAPLGIVYQTDAVASKSVKVIGTFPDDSHPPVIYPIALTKDSTNPDAVDLLNYIRSPATKLIFERWGFTVLK